MIGSLYPWQRRGLAVLSIGGCAIGLSSSITALLRGQVPAAALFPCTLGIAFFVWGVWCGVKILEGSRQALRRNALFWLAQTPLLQTPIVGYTVFCGAQFQVFTRLSPLDFNFYGSVLGAQFSLNLGQSGARTAIGVNLVALCIAFWLMRQDETADPALIPAASTP